MLRLVLLLCLASAPAAHTPCEHDDAVTRLFDWIDEEALGAAGDRRRSNALLCVGRRAPQEHRSLYVQHGVEVGEVLLKVPFSLTLNRLTAAEPPLRLKYPEPPRTLDGESFDKDNSAGRIHTLAALFLLHARHDKARRWSPYVASLPNASSLVHDARRGRLVLPMWYTKRQRKWLRGGIKVLARQQKSKIKQQWTRLHKQFSSAGGRSTARLAFGHPEETRLLDFKWALSMVFSRAFKIPRPWERKRESNALTPVCDDKGSVGSTTDLRYVLVPGVDLANYARKPTSFIRIHGASAASAVIELVAGQRLEPYQEVTLSYGQHESPCLHTLLHYGFCDDSDDFKNSTVPPSRARAAVITATAELALISAEDKVSDNRDLRVLKDALRKAERHTHSDACHFSSADGESNRLDDRNRCQIFKTVNQEMGVINAAVIRNSNIQYYQEKEKDD